MIRAPRLALYVLLVLMQILAPWVHAHTGEETGGFLHMPGLEILAKSSQDCAAADMQPNGLDVIVSMQAGLWDPPDLTSLASERQDQPWLPLSLAATFPRHPSSTPVAADIPPQQFRFSRHDAHPRAPPLNSSLF